VFIRNILILIVILFLALFIWLKVGIEIDTLKISNYDVGKLYIKLDKKLTLKADYITIPERKSKPSFDNIDETLERVKYILTFFEYIDLKTIAFSNNTLGIIFKNNLMEIVSKDYVIQGTIKREGKMLKANIPLLYIKKHNIILEGKFNYDLHEDILSTEGSYAFHDIKGSFSANKQEDNIQFTVKSEAFKELRDVIEKFNLDPSVKSWVLDKIQAKQYQLKYLSAKGKIKDATFRLDMDSLKAEALFYNSDIHFKQGLEAVKTDSFTLRYKDYALYFDLKNPIYQGKSLEGSKVSIVNLEDKNTLLKLDIRAHTAFDRVMKRLLKSYDINIPLTQRNGKVKVLFQGDIGLKNDYSNFLVDVYFSKSDIVLNSVLLPITKGSLHYEDNLINLKNINLKNELYAGVLDGEINLQKKKADLIFDAKYIIFSRDKESFFTLKDRQLPFVLSYQKDTTIDIEKLAVQIKSNEKNTQIKFKDLNKVKYYLADSSFVEKGGNLEISTKDFETFNFKGTLKRTSCFLYEKQDVCRVNVPFTGTINNENTYFYAFSKRLEYNAKKSRLKLTNLNIDLAKFIEASKTKKVEKKSKQKKALNIRGKNSHLRYKEHTLIVDSYEVEVQDDENIKATGMADGDIIKFSKKKNILSMQALRIKDKVLHPLINFKGLQKGRYSLKKSGNPEKVMQGEIIIEGGVMKNFKTYSDTLAFINTLPALAVLHNPGFSKEGFAIEEGVIEYKMISQEKIIFDSIYIRSNAATIVGKGELDLETKIIHMDLAIKVAREFGKVVGSIPLVGHILMGKEKSVVVGIKITGNIDKPKIKTSAAKDILSLPFEVIKRTLELPSQIIVK